MISPIRSLTRPTRRDRSAPWSDRAARANPPAAARSGGLSGHRRLRRRRGRLAGQRGRDDLAGASELSVDARVDLAGVGPGDRAAPADPPVGLDREVLDPAELRLQLVDALAHQLQVIGVHDQRHAAAIGKVAKRVASDVEHALGLDRQHAGDDLLGQAHRHLDRVLLEVGDHLLAQSLDRGGRRRDRGHGGLGVGAGGREPRGTTLGLAGGPRLSADLLGLGADGGQDVGDAVARPCRRRVELTEGVAVDWAPAHLLRARQLRLLRRARAPGRRPLPACARSPRSVPGPPRRRACAAAAGRPSPRRASSRRARTCSTGSAP